VTKFEFIPFIQDEHLTAICGLTRRLIQRGRRR